MYRRILVPIDGSDTSRRAVTEAAKVAHFCGARIDLLHIVEPVCSGFEPPEVYLKDVLPRLMEAGETLLEETASALRAEGLAVETVLIEGGTEHVWQFIVAQARVRDADLIVLGTHGRRGFSRLMMGSDAEQVARNSPIPALLIGPHGPAEQPRPATPTLTVPQGPIASPTGVNP